MQEKLPDCSDGVGADIPKLGNDEVVDGDRKIIADLAPHIVST